MLSDIELFYLHACVKHYRKKLRLTSVSILGLVDKNLKLLRVHYVHFEKDWCSKKRDIKKWDVCFGTPDICRSRPLWSFVCLSLLISLNSNVLVSVQIYTAWINYQATEFHNYNTMVVAIVRRCGLLPTQTLPKDLLQTANTALATKIRNRG